MKYRTIGSFCEISTMYKTDIFFCDIEGVILQPNIYYELLTDQYFFNLFLRIIEVNNVIPCKISDCIYLGKNFIRYLTDASIPNVFNILKNTDSNAKIFALSSGFPSIQKKDQIKKMRINFNGFLFTKRANKGKFLVNFLQSHNDFIGKKICVIDNHIHKLNDIYDEYASAFPQFIDQLELILYDNDFIKNITINDFINYWQDVVQNILNGKIDEIKNRINIIKSYMEKSRQNRLLAEQDKS